MKLLLSAVAMMIASPALAQTPTTGNHASHPAPAHADRAMSAQHADHGKAAAPAAIACTPEHAAMGHCKLVKPAQPAADPHAAHKMSPKK